MREVTSGPCPSDEKARTKITMSLPENSEHRQKGCLFVGLNSIAQSRSSHMLLLSTGRLLVRRRGGEQTNETRGAAMLALGKELQMSRAISMFIDRTLCRGM